MGKVETIKIWPISSTEMLNEELYKYKAPYKLYAEIVKINNSSKKKKKKLRSRMYTSSLGKLALKKTGKCEETFKTLNEVTDYLFSSEHCS